MVKTYKARNVVMLCFVLPCLVYLVCFCKYVCSYEHQVHGIDNGYRIPLWYPYDIHSGGYIREWGVPCRVHSVDLFKIVITKFRIADHCVFGKCQDGFWNGGLEAGGPEHFFIISTNHTDVVYYEREKEYLKACSDYGVDGSKLWSFDDNLKHFELTDAKPTPKNTFIHAMTHKWTLGSVLLCALVLACWFVLFKKFPPD